MDIRDALAAMASDGQPPEPAVVAADLARGRRAAARRRRVTVAAGALAVVGVLALPTAWQATRSLPQPPPALDWAQSAGGIRLVPYTGPPTEPFRTALMPQGWTVRSSGTSDLVLVPPGTDPAAGDYRNAIVIGLNRDYPEREPAGPGGAVVRKDSEGAMVWADRTDGSYLAVQFPPVAGGWTDAQLLEFIRGVQVEPGADVTNG